MSFTCPELTPTGLNVFIPLDKYDPEFKACLEKTAKLCESTPRDKSSENFQKVTKLAFDKVKDTAEFKEFYCQNFEKSKVSFNYDRKCDQTSLDNELNSLHSCEFISKDNADASEALALCQQFLNDEIKKPNYLTSELKTNFKKTLKDVIDGYNKIYPDNKDIKNILLKVSLETDFDYRLSTFVAGARDKSEVQGCDPTWGVAEWCKGDYFILPGGRIFSEPQNLELILAHEVGHIINKVSLPENAFATVTSKLMACNHLGSSSLDIDQLRSETSADLHMARYHEKFMQEKSVETHFCQYDKKEKYEKSNYLHPYHRQALINCLNSADLKK